ncbi:UDP-glucose 4-epimerase [Lapidilactobacillus concavus DSM 17758]|uniref:UDP-glucose 4-epimerase n=1 Tax=Lapidilactobacillus concavus DSM 17758 TaxID=1423735 RepID=A0A0R1W5U2_9LACO|nr:UDP-glucose 4-epimerase GalE [Lapidilactobacillus concavus]KRM09964.1 UDP-glucose 4-epimerase [Lapidilactobacillus concavus DSM 17758]GEL13562.1 UDP-glucose 4-epimerase GalE [Lapidilactobacillus concavus]
MTILVTGGAGYIGSHTTDRLIEQGTDVIVVDNLLTGHRAAINPKARFYEGDVRDRDFLEGVFTKEKIDGVVHFAANSLVGESMKDPLKYFDNNDYGFIVLLETMVKFDVKKLVFSSTAATYGEAKEIPITETTPQVPTNPYGESKLTMEKFAHWADVAHDLKWVALRYFNVAGAKSDGSIGEDHHPETHLIPIVLQVASGKREKLQIFGGDYATKDGTNVRDYVHVIDLADAHIEALNYLSEGNDSSAFNLGSANGFSNLEIVEAARKVTKQPIPYEIADRRPGDPSTLVASSEKAREVLGWKPNYDDMESIIATAWTWTQQHPNGYEK